MKDKRRSETQINRDSLHDKYLKDRSKALNLIGPMIGAQPPFEKCPLCEIGRLSTRQQDKAGEWYLVCNNSPLCKHTQKSRGKISTTQAPQGRTSKVQQKYGTEQQGELFCYSFGSRGKNRSGNKKTIDSDDLWDLIGTQGRVVSQSTHVYNSDQGWEQRE